MTEKGPQALANPDPDLLDRSSSIDSYFTFARGGRGQPNSGPEHNPVLEVSVSPPAVELRGEPVVRETQNG